MPELRPMRVEDAEEAHFLSVETFEALSVSRGEPPEPRPDPALAAIRFGHLVTTDPDGAWVATHAGAIVGCALALRRAAAYGEGARGRIILASPDPRALRAYFRLHPSASARGAPRVSAPAGVREGGPADFPLVETVDRHVRGAAHGPDMGALVGLGNRLLVAPDRGYAFVRPDGSPRLLAALDDHAAADLLRAALARADGDVTVEWLTAKQQWAIAVCVEAGLELHAGTGGVFVGGEVGPFAPYLPSGAFL